MKKQLLLFGLLLMAVVSSFGQSLPDVYEVPDSNQFRTLSSAYSSVVFDGSIWVRTAGSRTSNGGTIQTGPSGYYYARQYSGPVEVDWFGAKGDGITDDSQAIQKAIYSGNTLGGVRLGNKNYKIRQGLIVPRKRFLTGSGDAKITADFGTNWTGPYVAISIYISDPATSAGVADQMNCTFQGFKVVGLNNSAIQSTGIKLFTNSTNIPTIVNYSTLHSSFKDILISQFDKGIEMLEAWQVAFYSVKVLNCRMGLSVAGKSCNVMFTDCTFTNFSRDFTSSTDNTIGLSLDSGFHYANGAEGRPEGFIFKGCLVYGADIDVNVLRILHLDITNCILDGATKYAVYVLGPSGFYLRDSYVFSFGTEAVVYFAPVNVGTMIPATISGCNILGQATTVSGIKFAAGGSNRKSITIRDNKFNNLARSMEFIQGPENSTIEGNHGQSNTDVFITFQNGGGGTLVDGNTTSDSAGVLLVHPVVTSPDLRIGRNSSAVTRTHYIGKAVLLAGQTSVTLPNYFNYTRDYYYKAITVISQSQPLGNYQIQNSALWNDAKLTVTTAPSSNITIYYEAKAIPYNAF